MTTRIVIVVVMIAIISIPVMAIEYIFDVVSGIRNKIKERKR